MKAYISMRQPTQEAIWQHLLQNPEKESAAFLFVSRNSTPEAIHFNTEGHFLAGPEHFIAQESDYLELTDEARLAIIKTAHRLESSVVELHSHTGPWPAKFSMADRIGLSEMVPQMWWRLKNRPYLALVVTQDGFDALVWLDNPREPQALEGLLVNDTLIKPTNLSLKGWYDYGLTV